MLFLQAEIAKEIAQEPPATGVIDGQFSRRSDILNHPVFNRYVLYCDANIWQ